MRPNRPDLIVPIHDRRKRKRYLTIKTAGYTAIVFLVVFAAITIRSEMRDIDPGGFGGLLRRQFPDAVEQKPFEVVQEAQPVEDQSVPDPMLVAPLARSQWLEGEDPAVVMEITPRTATVGATQGRIAIVGGPEGLTVIQTDRQKPVLSGGFGQ